MKEKLNRFISNHPRLASIISRFAHRKMPLGTKVEVVRKKGGYDVITERKVYALIRREPDWLMISVLAVVIPPAICSIVTFLLALRG